MRRRPVTSPRLRPVNRVTPVAAAVITAIYGGPVAAGGTSAAGGADASGATSATSSEASGAGLEEVVVTATHREASAQDLPVSITAVSSAQLEEAGIEDMHDALGKFMQRADVVKMGVSRDRGQALLKNLCGCL